MNRKLNLLETNFPSYLDTSKSDLIEDFFIPALNNSIQYDRGVGFFSSGWLRIAAIGMAKFAAKAAGMHVVATSNFYTQSENLSQADIVVTSLGDMGGEIGELVLGGEGLDYNGVLSAEQLTNYFSS